MKTKIQIQSIFGDVLFELEKENNTVRDTLEEAIRNSANLDSADLRSAKNVSESYINQCSRDMLFIFERLKSELLYLREKLIKGEVDGTQYEGDCSCLIVSLGKGDKKEIEKACKTILFYDKGLHNFGEQWFWQIKKGDTPENSRWAEHVLMLIDYILENKPLYEIDWSKNDKK